MTAFPFWCRKATRLTNCKLPYGPEKFLRGRTHFYFCKLMVVPPLGTTALGHTVYICTSNLEFPSQLNKYQTNLYLLELSHQMTNVCLLISDFWLFLHVGNIKLFCTCKNQNKKQFCVPVLQTFSNLGIFSEINKQFHVKSRLTYRSYRSVW